MTGYGFSAFRQEQLHKDLEADFKELASMRRGANQDKRWLNAVSGSLSRFKEVLGCMNKGRAASLRRHPVLGTCSDLLVLSPDW